MKPFLRWAGSKYNQGDIWIAVQDLFEPYKDTHTLVEPFCGGLGMTLRLQPETAVLYDINVHLIDLYRHILEREFIQNVVFNSVINYQAMRHRFNIGRTTRDFLWLNQCCFNGLYRENSSGNFNVPIGRDSKKTLLQPKLINFEEFKIISKNWEFVSGEFGTCLKNTDAQSFVYCDPPYDTMKDGFTGYNKYKFGWSEQLELANILSTLKCPVVASNLATERILELYTEKGFTIKLLPGKRSISCNGDRMSVQEMLAYRGCG